MPLLMEAEARPPWKIVGFHGEAEALRQVLRRSRQIPLAQTSRTDCHAGNLSSLFSSEPCTIQSERLQGDSTHPDHPAPGRLTESNGESPVKRITHTLAATFLLLCFYLIANAQALSPEEQKIVRYIDAHSAETVSLLEKVINIESATQNLAGVKSVGEVFKGEFAALGMTARWIDM